MPKMQVSAAKIEEMNSGESLTQWLQLRLSARGINGFSRIACSALLGRQRPDGRGSWIA